MDSVKNSVLKEEARRQSNASSWRSNLFVTEPRGRSSNRDPKRDKNRRKSKSNKFANIQYYLCHKK